MPIALLDGQICFVRLQLDPSEVRHLLKKHAVKYPGAGERENMAMELIDSGIRVTNALEFLESVVRWGRGHRFVGRLLGENKPDQMASALRSAVFLLDQNQVSAAVAELQNLRFLGQSFASKVARFLAPTKAVILDEVIRGAIGYRENQAGYEEFLEDCAVVQEAMRAHLPDLRICDIEAAVFAKIQGY